MARNGKIARLPRHVREKLNRRLEDGETGELLLDWLNGLPEVQEIVQKQFARVPVSKHNLSEWRMGGYEDWLKRGEACELVRELAEQVDDLDDAAEHGEICDYLAMRLAAELTQAAKSLLAETTDTQERWRRLQELLPQLAQLRRADHRAWRLRIDQEQWEREKERMDKEKWDRKLQETKDRALAPIWGLLKRGPLVEVFGGGEQGEKIADYINEIQNMHIPEPGDPPMPNRTTSDPVAVSRRESHPDELEEAGE